MRDKKISPTPLQLWAEAEGNLQLYRLAMIEAGHSIPGAPRRLPTSFMGGMGEMRQMFVNAGIDVTDMTEDQILNDFDTLAELGTLAQKPVSELMLAIAIMQSKHPKAQLATDAGGNGPPPPTGHAVRWSARRMGAQPQWTKFHHRNYKDDLAGLCGAVVLVLTPENMETAEIEIVGPEAVDCERCKQRRETNGQQNQN